MKKFCNKAKEQWRVTVPNINSSIFKRSTGSKEPRGPDNKLMKSCSSGSYDLQTAALEFEKRGNNVLFLESDSSDSESSDTYEDATALSERLSSADDMDASLYVDVDSPQKVETSKCVSASEYNGGVCAYDVPKISFSFFEEQNAHEYQATKVQTETSPEPTKEASAPPHEDNDWPKHVTGIEIVLSAPEMPKNFDATMSKSENSLIEPEIKSVQLYLTRSLRDCSIAPKMRKSGSDPNISLSTIDLVEDDGLYKVPGAVRRYRYSQSLDGGVDVDLEIVSSAHSSIEHISCSQIIVPKEAEAQEGANSAQNSVTMDYCKTRTKMPQKIRKITLLRRPKNTAWVNLRSKLNNVMAEQAAKQRVGAFEDKERAGVTIEEMYKSSKDKCRKMLKTTGKMFAKPKRDQENVDPIGAAKTPKGLKASDIEHTVRAVEESWEGSVKSDKTDKTDRSEKSDKSVMFDAKAFFGQFSNSSDSDKKSDLDFSTIKSSFRRSKSYPESSNGFEDLRRYVKQGGDFCKELSAILQERSDAELQYAKSLSKLSGKLARACREGVGGLNDAWRSVAHELETKAEAHRLLGNALSEEIARPLRTLTENQHKIRKQAEAVVDKASKGLGDWRGAEAKTKKHSHACARDNEKLQDALLDNRVSKTTSLIQLAHMHNQKVLSEKENAKLEGKKRKAEDAVKKADIEYYTLCVRAERARLEWESAVLKGSSTFHTLEEERLDNLKSILTSYLHHNNELGPRLIEVTDRLSGPVAQAEPFKDLSTFESLRNSSQQTAEQLLPDFYCEHITLAMNRERRKQALVKLLQLIRQDIERERKSKNGLENLSKAMRQTPNFGAEESQQNVSEKLYHMKSMLTYLEGARYKVQSALAELDSRPRAGHPLAPHITITRDKSGLQQSVLKVPQWLRDKWVEPDTSPMSEKSIKSDRMSDSEYPEPDWMDRGAADGNSNQPDSDFDEFSSQGSSSGGLCATEENPVQPIAQCKALYSYTPNLPDELPLHPGDVLSVYRKQEDGWWLGECKGSVGIFPATYVETLQT